MPPDSIDPPKPRRRPSRLWMLAVAGTLAVLAIAVLRPPTSHAPAEGLVGTPPVLPAPDEGPVPVVNFPTATGWPEGKAPIAPEGFTVTRYAAGLDHPRWLYVLPDGDVLVAESSTVLRPARVALRQGRRVTSAQIGRRDALGESHHAPPGRGRRALRPWAGDLPDRASPALRDARPRRNPLRRRHRRPPRVRLRARIRADRRRTEDGDRASGRRLQQPLDAERHSQPRGDEALRDRRLGKRPRREPNGIDDEALRADILELDPDGGHLRVFASGIRNPVGLAWAPGSETLWVVANERDMLGNDLVPDYLTSVRDGGFYGWPYSYWGSHLDPRVHAPQLGASRGALAPDYALGSHVAALGARVLHGRTLPRPLQGRGLHRRARLIDNLQAVRRIQGRVRTVPGRSPGRSARGLSHGVHAGRPSGHELRKTRRRGRRRSGRPARRRRRGRLRLACGPLEVASPRSKASAWRPEACILRD